MDGTVGVGFTNASHDEWLNIFRLDLDENHGAPSDRFQRFAQSRYPDVGTEAMRCNDAESSARDGDISRLRHTFRMQHGIVMNNDYPIARCMNVELDSLGAQLDRPFERGDRVFRQRVVLSAVGDPERWASLRWQAFLRERGLGRPNL